MHKWSSKMQFSFATGLWRLSSFIVPISLNCSWYQKIIWHSEFWPNPQDHSDYRDSEVTDQNDINNSSGIQLHSRSEYHTELHWNNACQLNYIPAHFLFSLDYRQSYRAQLILLMRKNILLSNSYFIARNGTFSYKANVL